MRPVAFLFAILLIGPYPAGAQHYENLVLEGGGIRGIAYAGALGVLEEQHQTNRLRRVAGTSVGGLVAALFALGYSAAELEGILQDLQINAFNDGSWFFLGGQARFRKQYGWYRGDRLEAWLGELIRKKTGDAGLTFGSLRKLAGTTKGYRELYITATDLTGQRAAVFSADLFPQMEIKTAVRASVSIPLYFTGVLLDDPGRRFRSQKDCLSCHLYVDGGLLANYPLALFDSLQDGRSVPNPATLGLKLERVAQMQHNEGDGSIAPFPIAGINSYVGALYNLCIEGLNRKIPFEVERFRTIYISTGDIRPRVRKISRQDKETLYRNGREGAEAFLRKKAGN